jgi:hypothetical protein
MPFGRNVREFFNTYPLTAKFSCEGLKHLTTQEMAFLL